MSKIKSKLTVLFEEPYWVGIYEREYSGHYEASKIIFGGEPKDYEVYRYMLDNSYRLKFSPPVPAGEKPERKINPKRLQRQIRSQIKSTGVGTKAQQALNLQRDEHKLERKTRSRDERQAKKERQFQLRQAKKKEKHRGH